MEGRVRDRDKLEREGEKEQTREDKNMQGIVANICHHDIMWHAMSALGARVAHFGPRKDHLTRIRDPNE